MSQHQDSDCANLTRSRWRLLLRGYVTLILAVTFGMMISLPVIVMRGRTFVESNYLLGNSPKDDLELNEWAKSLKRVTLFNTNRDGQLLSVRSEFRGFAQVPSEIDLIKKMQELGYTIQEMRGGRSGVASVPGDFLTDAPTLAVMLAGMQVAFCLFGMVQLRRATRNGEPIPPLLTGNHWRAIGIGLAGGVLLIGIGVLYSTGLHGLLGYSPPSPWSASDELPGSAKLVFLLFGALGAPIAEEIFFRGFLFGSFKGAGYVVLGIVVSAVLFTVVHVTDPYSMPAICLYGVLLAMMYHRSGSIITPITAHCVNNGVGIAIMVLS